MKKLIALCPVLYMGRSYERGAALPTQDQTMTDAWLRAKSAVWREDGPPPGDTSTEAKEPAQEPQEPAGDGKPTQEAQESADGEEPAQEAQEPADEGEPAQEGQEPTDEEEPSNGEGTAQQGQEPTVDGGPAQKAAPPGQKPRGRKKGGNA